MEKGHKTNKVLTVLLIIGTITVFFPLYMAVIIAFKKPSEMTNDVAGALALEFFQFYRSNAGDRFLAFSWKQFTYYACDNSIGNFDPFDCRICDRTWYAQDQRI